MSLPMIRGNPGPALRRSAARTAQRAILTTARTAQRAIPTALNSYAGPPYQFGEEAPAGMVTCPILLSLRGCMC